MQAHDDSVFCSHCLHALSVAEIWCYMYCFSWIFFATFNMFVAAFTQQHANCIFRGSKEWVRYVVMIGCVVALLQHLSIVSKKKGLAFLNSLIPVAFGAPIWICHTAPLAAICWPLHIDTQTGLVFATQKISEHFKNINLCGFRCKVINIEEIIARQKVTIFSLYSDTSQQLY